MIFTLEKPDEKGPGYWKLNASILDDRPYINLITCNKTWQQNNNITDTL